jgi:phosphate-selective porin OprO/OprP
MFGRWSMRLFAVAVAAGAFALAGGPAQSQEGDLKPRVDLNSQADLKSLLERLERLEKQNEELRARLTSLPAAAPENVNAVDPHTVETIINRYMQKQADAKAKEAAKDAKDAGKAPEFQAVGSDLSFKARWNHGLFVETPLKDFKVHVGGRTQFDTVWMRGDHDVMFASPGGTGRIDDGFNFRRARLEIDGTCFEVIDFFMEYDFLNTTNVDPNDPASSGNVANTPAPTDLWVQITQIPWLGVFRVGNMKPPISFEHLTSSRFLNFLERSYCFDAFIGGLDNGFRPGFMVFNWTENERATAALGLFKNNGSVLGWNVGDGEYDVTGRVTWLPVYEHNGRCLVHLGLGVSHRDLDQDRLRLRARTLLRNGPAALHTTLADARMGGESQTLVVPEFAVVWGPFSMQAEYFGSFVPDATFPVTAGAVPLPRGDAYFQGAYVEALYFLTGEHRPYNKYGGSGAAFTRVVPNSNYFFVGGDGGNLFSAGAWQVGARYSWIDLQDKEIAGGTLHDITVGLNWFLNPNLKFQWNYSIAHREVSGPADGYVQGFGMRMAFDF